MGRVVPVTEAARRRYNIEKENKKGKFPKKVSIIPFAVTLIAAVAARCFQLKTNMDWSSGRYIDPSLAKNYPFWIIVLGMIITLVILITGSAKDKVVDSCILINPMRLRYDRLNPKISSPAAYSALLVALLIVVEIAFDFVSIISVNKDIRDQITDQYERKDYNLLTGYTFGNGLEHFLMVLTAVAFICIGINIFKKVGFTHANCATITFFAIWKTVDVFNLATENTVMAVSSEKVYEMFSGMASALFFLLVARFFNGMEKPNTRILLCFMGYLTAVLTAVSSLPRYILLLDPSGYTERTSMDVPPMTDIGVIFMAITLVCVFWSTYVYRTMPRLVLNGRRWNRAPLTSKYEDMESIDESGADKE